MTTNASVDQILGFLAGHAELNPRWLGTSEQRTVTIRGLAIDQEAVSGQLAWLSAKQALKRPDAPREFRGSLLIAPESVTVEGKRPIITSSNPKLAFIFVVEHFFPGIEQVAWPQREQGCSADADVSPRAILGPGVVIGPRVSIGDDVTIGPNTVLASTTIQQRVRIGANCSIGLPGFGYEKDASGRYHRFPHLGGVVIKADAEIGSNTCIDRGSLGDTIIGRGAKVDNLVHVAHNVHIADNAVVIANAMLGGSVRIEEGVWVAPSVSIMNGVTIGRSAVLGLGAVVLKDVSPETVVIGNPAKPLKPKGEGQ